MKKLIFAMPFAVAACIPVAEQPTPGQLIERLPAPQAQQLMQLGGIAAKACVQSFSSAPAAEQQLRQAGFTMIKEFRSSRRYAFSLAGGRTSITGKPYGAVNVEIWLKPDISGFLRCLSSVDGFNENEGNVFYIGYQAALKTMPAGSYSQLSGTFEHGSAEVYLRYRTTKR